MEHGTNTAFVGVQLGRALGAGAADLEAIFYGALVKDAGCGACGAVLARYFADDEMVPRLDLNLVDLHSPRNMAAWTMSRLHLDPASRPARPAGRLRLPVRPGDARGDGRRTVSSPPTSPPALGSALTCRTPSRPVRTARRAQPGVRPTAETIPARPRYCTWRWPPTWRAD